MSVNYVLVNGLMLHADEATLNIRDLAIQRGYGVFDFFKTVNNVPVFLDDHLDRFYNSAKIMHLGVSITREELKKQLQDLISANNIPDSGIRLTLTGGYSADGFNIAEPNLIITQQKFEVNRNYEKTIKLITYNYRRQLNAAKTLDYMTAIWLQREISKQNADDVLYHHEGLIGECPRANVFIVSQNNEVLTPFNHILKGVTRKHVLRVSEKLFDTAERDVTVDDLRDAKEVFITSTTKNIMPVSSIGGRLIGDGKPGPVTRTLAMKYSEIIYGLDTGKNVKELIS